MQSEISTVGGQSSPNFGSRYRIFRS